MARYQCSEVDTLTDVTPPVVPPGPPATPAAADTPPPDRGLRPGLLGLGTFFVLLGALPLAAQLGLFNPGVLLSGWRLWPILLIAVGLSLLLGTTGSRWVGPLVFGAAAGVVGGSVLAAGLPFFDGGCADANNRDASDAEVRTTEVTGQEGTFTGDEGTVELRIQCGRLQLDVETGSSWLVEARGPAPTPRVEFTASDLLVAPDGDEGGLFAVAPDAVRRSWRVTLPSEQSLDLEISAAGSHAEIDLDGATLTSLDVTFNATSGALQLTDASLSGDLQIEFNAAAAEVAFPGGSPSFAIEIGANATDLDLCIPEGLGILIAGERNATGENFEEAGLIRRNGGGDGGGGDDGDDGDGGDGDDEGSVWMNRAYETAERRAEIVLDANASSITLHTERGCQ